MAHPALETALDQAAKVRDVYSLREIHDDVLVIYEVFSFLFLSLSSSFPTRPPSITGYILNH